MGLGLGLGLALTLTLALTLILHPNQVAHRAIARAAIRPEEVGA